MRTHMLRGKVSKTRLENSFFNYNEKNISIKHGQVFAGRSKCQVFIKHGLAGGREGYNFLKIPEINLVYCLIEILR